MKPIFYAYMIAVLVFSACSSGKSTFERGNYYEAVITSVNRLRRNSDHKKSVETLRQAYPMAVAFYEDRANTSLASTEPFKWTEVVKSYTSINVMHDEIKRCPGALAVIPNPVNYYSKLQEARQNAAEEHYAAGIVALQFGDRENAKKAYRLFKTANDFVAGYKDVNSYLEAALAAATVKILVEPIPVHSRAVGVSADFFNDKISEFVHSASINEFVKFYTRAEAQKLKMNPDHIIQLQFDDFSVGQVNKHEKEIQLTKDSVELGTYVSATAASQQNNNAKTPVGSSRLITTGNPVTATTQTPVNANQSNTTASADAERAERERLERERIARELAEKQRLEKELADKALADKLRSEREAAERERLAREAADKAAAERALAEKQRLERERLEKEQAEKASAEKAKAESDAAQKELLAKQTAEKLQAEKELAEKQRLERERLEKEQADKALAEKLKAEREAAEKERLAKVAAEQALAEKQRLEKEKLARELAEKEKAEKVKAEKEKADKEKADKEKAEKEKAEKEKGEKEKGEKAKYVDPSINAADTTDVKDPVTICHIPPGNKTNTRTLVINRAALKAHLAHGDAEGDCGGAKPDQKGKPEDKGNKPENKQGDKNDKAPDKKGTGKLDRKKEEHALHYGYSQMLLASREGDPGKFMSYFDDAAPSIEGDTNKVYGTVKATLYHFTKTTTSNGIVSFRIINAKTGAVLTAEKLPGEFVWVSEWATFNGDERALSAEQLRLTRLKEQPAPAPQDLFIEFTKPIYEQITTKIRDFYKNY